MVQNPFHQTGVGLREGIRHDLRATHDGTRLPGYMPPKLRQEEGTKYKESVKEHSKGMAALGRTLLKALGIQMDVIVFAVEGVPSSIFPSLFYGPGLAPSITTKDAIAEKDVRFTMRVLVTASNALGGIWHCSRPQRMLLASGDGFGCS